MNDIISFVIALILLGLSYWVLDDKSDLKGTSRDIGFGLIVSILINQLVQAWNNKEYLKIFFQSHLQPKKPVRVSMAYLFRIEIDGQFMLVRNHKKPDRGYQPVGGVYKYLKAETTDLFQSFTIDVDNSIPVDDDSRNDLRCIINERRKLPKFIKWFHSKKDRELDPWREFYEELVAEGILQQTVFPYIQYRYRKADYEGIKPPDQFKYDEFLYADIVELKPEDSTQLAALRQLFINRMHSQDYMFATPNEIRKGRTDSGQIILPHAVKLLC